MSEYIVRVFQPIVQPYRVALYEGLRNRFGRSLQIRTSSIWPGSKTQSRTVEGVDCDAKHRVVKVGPILWQCGFSLKGLKSHRDVIVMCGNPHQLSSLWIALRAKLNGIGVIWWGHHLSASSSKLSAKIRVWMMKALSHVVLCYTENGLKWLGERGFDNNRIFATCNTIDASEMLELTKSAKLEDITAFKRLNKLDDSFVMLFCSVLRPKTRLDLIINALASDGLKQEKIKLVIIGDGPERDKMEKLSEDLGVAHKIIWVGDERDQKKLAPWFLSSDLFVYPGAIGLSIFHAFAYGLPVVTHGNSEHQMPEYEAFEDGANGLSFREGDFADLAKVLRKALDNRETLGELGANARKVVTERYSMSNMVKNYIAAVEACQKLVSL